MPPSERADDPSWLERFHAGDHAVIEQCYRNHFGVALAAARRIVSNVDAETVTHEVFYRLLSEPTTRRGFGGGKLGAWITKLSTNAAIDHQRRRSREVGPSPEEHSAGTDHWTTNWKPS